jgi:hypothetical protein
MFETIELFSRVSAQGEIVEILGNGEVVIRDGRTYYRGRPIGRGPARLGRGTGVVTDFRPLTPGQPDTRGA